MQNEVVLRIFRRLLVGKSKGGAWLKLIEKFRGSIKIQKSLMVQWLSRNKFKGLIEHFYHVNVTEDPIGLKIIYLDFPFCPPRNERWFSGPTVRGSPATLQVLLDLEQLNSSIPSLEISTFYSKILIKINNQAQKNNRKKMNLHL